MFGWLFGRKEPIDPPTDKQLAFTKRLGVVVNHSMSKWDVSKAIDQALARKRNGAPTTEASDRQERVVEFGVELFALEDKWNELAERGCYILAACLKGKSTIVDVLSLTGASVNERRKLILEVDAPKLVKDRHAGDYLEWQKPLELPLEKLRYFEDLGADFEMWAAWKVGRGIDPAHD